MRDMGDGIPTPPHPERSRRTHDTCPGIASLFSPDMTLAAAPDERTLVHVLRKAAAAFPDKDWLVTDAGAATYREMETLSNRLANGLTAAGVGGGRTLLVMMQDVIEFVAVWAAMCKTAGIEVPVSNAHPGRI